MHMRPSGRICRLGARGHACVQRNAARQILTIEFKLCYPSPSAIDGTPFDDQIMRRKENPFLVFTAHIFPFFGAHNGHTILGECREGRTDISEFKKRGKICEMKNAAVDGTVGLRLSRLSTLVVRLKHSAPSRTLSCPSQQRTFPLLRKREARLSPSLLH